MSHCSAETAEGVRQVIARLRAPLQVAVAGRISSGKSTLVNALIGRRVAPTAVGECTRLVTRFSYGNVDRVEVVLRDGSRQALPFDADGMMPADVARQAGVTLPQVSHLEAYLTSSLLTTLTVIDTPGLGSVNDDSVARTVDVLDDISRSAVAGAEAVLYVLTQSVRADDAEVLTTFTAATAGRAAGPVNALALLNKADTLAPESVAGAGDNVWAAARLVAARQAQLLGPRVADVLPVVGLLAETCESGAFEAADADALRTVAATDADTCAAMLLAADLFLSLDCPVDVAVRQRLLERLDLYGIACAVRALRADPHMPVGRLRAALDGASGLAPVRDRLTEVFSVRADAIKAAAALASLTSLAQASEDATDQQLVRGGIERLLRLPEAHQLRMMEALTLVSSGAVQLPAELAHEALRLGTSTDPRVQLAMPGARVDQLATCALERAGWWRSFASLGASAGQERVAHVVHRAYFLLWQQLQGASS
ncbi:MAG: dynamin family protein [Mycobacteriaceae bacterium]